MTTKGPRFSATSPSNASSTYFPASNNVASNILRTRATSNEVCRDFLRGRCTWGHRCCHIHILPPRESQTTLSKVPLDSSKVVATQYIVKIPNPSFQAEMPTIRLNSQSSCFSDSTELNSRTPVVRLRRERPPENPSQNTFPNMCPYDDSNSWGAKTEESSWTSNTAENTRQTPQRADDLNSWASKMEEGSWTRNTAAEVPAQSNDLNSWAGKTVENSWSGHNGECPTSHQYPVDDLNSWGRNTEPGSSWINNRAANSSRSSVHSTHRYDGLSYDENTNFWGFKPDESSWGCTSLSSDDSFTESSSSTGTISSQSSSTHLPRTEFEHPRPPFNTQTCRDWVRGYCRFGPRCKFVHAHTPEFWFTGSTAVCPASTGFLDFLSTLFLATKHPPPLYPQTCRNWLRDRCSLGYNCRWVHRDLEYDSPDPPSSAPARPHHSPPPARHRPPPAPEPDLSITVHDHTKVKIGSGFEIHDVTTSVETPWVILGNVPSRATASSIEHLLSPFGSALDIQLPRNPPKDLMIVKARFASHAEAIHASNALDGSTFLNTRISARLPRQCTQRNSVDPGLRLSKEPRKRWRSQRRANAGTIMFMPPFTSGSLPSASSPLSSRICPPTANEDFMHRFAAPEDIMWERPNYVSLAPAIEGIKRILRAVGNFLEIEGAGALHGRKPVFTGKTRIFARHVQSLTYHLDFDDYYNNVRLIDSLRESIFRKGSMMTVSTRRLPSSMLIRLSAEGVKPLGWLKAELEKILRGEILRRDGVAVWDFFFVRPVGVEYLRSIEAKEPNVRIEADKVRRTLKVFGTPSGRAAVQTTLLQKMSELKAQQVRIIRIPGRVVGAFVATQLSSLCKKYGNESIYVDMWERIITLRGGDELYEAAVDAVHQAQQSPLAQRPYAQNLVECPVCFNEIVSPITLHCGHRLCRACLSQYLLAAIDNRRFPLTCLGDEAKCTVPISLSIARTVLQPNEFNSVVEASISAYVHAHAKELHYCPSPDCIQIYRTGPKGTVAQCPSCLLRICTHCHAEAHDGFMCSEQDADKLSSRSGPRPTT
ncbi:RING finger protein [Mycena sanguinolenta]|uniref:RBR-type E3 ubiquitin transferase n=1 Tax=Mycena sanguinolenta TaxID=230812 RepID=A0A8H6XZ33_9AGAR|nr:RING finger protein [Mycena sanguinolenta]